MAMEKCPKCGKYTIDYNGYRGKYKCLNTGCDYQIEDKEKGTHSRLEHNLLTRKIERVTFDSKGSRIESRVVGEMLGN